MNRNLHTNSFTLERRYYKSTNELPFFFLEKNITHKRTPTSHASILLKIYFVIKFMRTSPCLRGPSSLPRTLHTKINPIRKHQSIMGVGQKVQHIILWVYSYHHKRLDMLTGFTLSNLTAFPYHHVCNGRYVWAAITSKCKAHRI